MSSSSDALLRFYSGTGTDHRGRRLEDLWRFSLDELEESHDYIQWLFPLVEKSQFNAAAPVLDDVAITRFRSDAALRRRLERSLTVMLHFYGFELEAERIVPSWTFAERAKTWLTPGNHNFLRLTRILKSLTVLGLAHRGTQLLQALEEIYSTHSAVIGPRTILFWRSALSTGMSSK